MHVATLRLTLRLAECRTLRQKRRLLHSMIDKLRRHFNIAATEVHHLDSPTESRLGIVTVGRSRRETREVLLRVAEAIGAHPHAELLDHEIEDLR